MECPNAFGKSSFKKTILQDGPQREKGVEPLKQSLSTMPENMSGPYGKTATREGWVVLAEDTVRSATYVPHTTKMLSSDTCYIHPQGSCDAPAYVGYAHQYNEGGEVNLSITRKILMKERNAPRVFFTDQGRFFEPAVLLWPNLSGLPVPLEESQKSPAPPRAGEKKNLLNATETSRTRW